MRVLLEKTTFLLDKIFRIAGIIRVAGIIGGRALYEVIWYVLLGCTMCFLLSQGMCSVAEEAGF